MTSKFPGFSFLHVILIVIFECDKNIRFLEPLEKSQYHFQSAIDAHTVTSHYIRYT